MNAQPVVTHTKEYKSEYKGVSQLLGINSGGAQSFGRMREAATKSVHCVTPLAYNYYCQPTSNRGQIPGYRGAAGTEEDTFWSNGYFYYFDYGDCTGMDIR